MIINFNQTFVEVWDTKSTGTSSSSNQSKISASGLKRILERLMNQKNKASTSKTYLSIWRQFNKFLINLDEKPPVWEDRVTLFVGYLIDRGIQSSTVKSYVSAIKRILVDDGYEWKDQRILLTSLTRACRLVNDRVYTRLPIQGSLLELILFEVDRHFSVVHNQPYLKLMYQTMFAMAYYGLMRVGELMLSPHVVKAKDVHMAGNKDKLLIVLHSS